MPNSCAFADREFVVTFSKRTSVAWHSVRQISEYLIMRSVVFLVMGIGLLSFASCQKFSEDSSAPDPTPASQRVMEPERSDSHGSLHEVAAVSSTNPGKKPTSKRKTHAEHGKIAELKGHTQSNRHFRRRTGHQHSVGHSEQPHFDAHAKHIAIGDKVPDFEVTIDGKKVKLSELRKDKTLTEDGTLVLTFWCSFCHSCRHVEGHLDKLAQKYKGKVGVIALDASDGETTEDVAEFAKEQKLTLPIAINASGSAADIFGTRVTTTTVVIDSKGVLRYCGQFGDQQHTYAADALKSVVAGEEVQVKKTKHKG